MIRFALLVLVNVALFLRPAELVPALESAPVYEVAILAALALSAGTVLGQLDPAALAARPITAFVLGLLASVVLSHLSRLATYEARASGVMFAKVVLYYLLLVAGLRTPLQLQAFLWCLAGLMCAQVTLGLLQYFGHIDIEALRAFDEKEYDPVTGELTVLARLCGAGIFNDPNDLCVLLAVGVVLSLYLLGDRRAGPARFLWVGPLGVFLAAIPLTHSRGGLLALAGGLGTLAVGRLGARRGLLLLAVVAPVGLVAVGGRQTRFSVDDSEDTSQHRMRLWSDGLMMVREKPVFGVGQGEYATRAGLTAHNSYVEAFAELGLVGGTCWVGAFAYAVGGLVRVGRGLHPHQHPTLSRLRPYLLAMVVALMVGMFSLSRIYTPPTYLMLGLCTAYLRQAAVAAPAAVPRLTRRLAARTAALSLVCLIGLQFFVLLFVRWS